MLEALVEGKACYARLYSYSRLTKGKPLTALGCHQGGSSFLRPQYPSAGFLGGTAA